MLTGFDAPPLHTLYLDRPLKGALLMQTLARVNRTFRGKEDGLLVAYAPLADNLSQGAGRVHRRRDQEQQAGRHATSTRPSRCAASWSRRLDELLRRIRLARRCSTGRHRKRWLNAAIGATELPARSPRRRATSRRGRGDASATRFRRLASQLARAWALVRRVADSSTTCAPRSQFYEEVRVWMAKFDAAGPPGRAASRSPRRSSACSARSIADVDRDRRGRSTSTRPPACPSRRCRRPQPGVHRQGAGRRRNPHLAIEALRKLADRGVGARRRGTTWCGSGRSPSASPS